MRSKSFKAALIKSGLAASVLLLASGASFAQQQVNLTAGPSAVTMPDGSVVPMWGYSCAPLASGVTSTATCAALNPSATGWSPVVITVPTGQDLQINLTNNLSFTPAGATTANGVPTSLVIYGQLGGGLGSNDTTTCVDSAGVGHGAKCTPSPSHVQQGVTWATVNTAGAGAPTFTPPPQGPRVQSWGTEVAPGGTASLCWGVCPGINPAGTPQFQPGTYLIESGTHPSIQGPMGLYGILVVTTAPTAASGTETAAGTAYGAPGTPTAVSYDGEVPLLFGEIDPVQNNAVNTAVSTAGFLESSTVNLNSNVASVTVASGGAGYTSVPTVNFIGGGGSGAAATAVVDTNTTSPTYQQVIAINVTSAGAGYTSIPTVTLTGGGATTAATASANLSLSANEIAFCSGGAKACYPPAVNYTPLYYTINGVAFSRTNATASLFPITPGTLAPVSGTGSVLVRLVNAGLRMHVPSIVGSSANQTYGTTTTTRSGFSLIAEDGNPLPGVPRVQSEVFMAAGKTYDVMINAPAPGSTALAVYDRELSLSGNAIERDAGMLAYIGTAGAQLPAASSLGAATAVADTYNSLVSGMTLTVSDPSKGVMANDINVYGVALSTPASNGTVTLNRNGTFTYVPNTGSTATSDSFQYCANGSTTICATVTLAPGALTGTTTVVNQTFNANTSTYVAIKPPGLLAGAVDSNGLPMTVVVSSIAATGMTIVADANGGFTASTTTSGTHTFTFTAQNSQGRQSNRGTVTVNFLAPSNLSVTVLDGYDKTTVIGDYRWIIEEDRTFYVNPACVQNPPPATCPTATIPGQGVQGIVPTLGVNFHTSYMPYVAQGCTGPVSCESGQTLQGVPAVCDVGNGTCRTTGTQLPQILPSQVRLDPTKRYYISVLPGDAANPFYGASPNGHGMGGAPIAAACTPVPPATTCTGTFAPVTVLTQPSPYPPADLSVFVFEDDFPLNGEQDGGGGVDVLSPNEPGLGGFQIHLWDAMGGNGDFTGQMTYDMFNQPLTNKLDGTVDPLTGLNACPITQIGIANPGTNATTGPLGPDGTQQTTAGITGMIVTCPKFESDGQTLSPLAGQAVISNLMPGRWGVIATPGADRIARGEEWLQTNTLDGQKAHDSFTRIGEPSYFQEFGPAGFHVSIGFANPAIINARKPFICNGTDANSPNPGSPMNCANTLKGKVTSQRLSRTPDERLYESGSHDAYAWTQCYVSFGDPDGEDFAFTKCDADGNFTLTGLPDGDWRVTTFDQWNDQLVDGLSTPVRLGAATNASCPGSASNASTCDLGDVAATQWQTNLYTKTFIDDNKDGVAQSAETGIPFANVAVRLRDGSLENLLVTDFTGTANFNETFPLFAWYTVETDVTRYKNTGTHAVYDAGGPADGTTQCGNTGATGYPPCANSTIGKNLANTVEMISLPDGTGGTVSLRVPGSVYCAGADCTGKSIQSGPTSSDPASSCTTATTAPYATTCSTVLSTGRIDNPWMGAVEGWQGFPGQNSFLEFGKAPYYRGENGGIKGHVIYASTRPFDDPQMLVQTQWEPLVPHVTINLYQEGFGPDGVTPTLTLVDTTQTSSWDDWAQGFHLAADGVTRIPNMNCPGQGAPLGQGINNGVNPDLFFFSLYDQPQYLDWYNSQHGGPAFTPLPYNAQFKCYDGMHNWNQLQPAPYDGMYQFPSVTAWDPTTGKPTATNCKVCVPDPVPATGDGGDALRTGLPMLPPGKYVVEVVPPPGFELVKEEDKNILIGDNFIAPVTQQFGGLGNVFIIPDQASVSASQQYAGAGYNANNAQNPTQSFGASPNNGIVPAFVPEPTWPCVGEARIVPDYISLYPQSHQVSPFAGATRNLCDRKEVTLTDQTGAIAKFYIFTSTHIASKFTGGITDDYTSEFDPFSPQFGEKFAPPDLPVSIKDWTGSETNRVYADHWGAYNGMTYSTWEVNPPNPTGYSPTMMVVCMNDPGPIPGPGGTMVTDPLFTQGYSQFCYELPFMPGTTQYLDTPVVPTSAFAGAGYNNVDCWYQDATPAIKEVDGDGIGPWVSVAGHTITITSLGDQQVPNYAYSGPSATTAPYNMKTITRHYGFGATRGSGTAALVDANGTAHALGSITWSDTTITGTVPTLTAAQSTCPIQQQAQYGGSAAQCGQLVITAGNGKQSIDTVTVTIGGKAPTHVAASGSIQAAIDVAAPGDLIMVDPTCNTAAGAATSCATTGAVKTTAAHNEILLMWKPVRLQGVGAASSLINANAHPAGKLDPWRRSVNCLFGLSMSGQPATVPSTGGSNPNPFDPTNTNTCPYGETVTLSGGLATSSSATGPDGNPWTYFLGTGQTDSATGTATAFPSPQVDRLPTEAVVGWDATQNGNLAEQLQEPSLMGALEGAGITVLAKGMSFGGTANNPFSDGTEAGAFPATATLLTGHLSSAGTLTVGDANSNCHNSSTDATNPYPSNFVCNPSSIDGLTITNSSQGGGGVFVHAWGHYLQIANNRILNNAGTLSGGINLGQGEFPASYIQGAAANAAPGSCATSTVNGVELPYCHNLDVNIHNNSVTLNSSTGDELFSATPAGAGGVSICTGSDYYKFKYNWVCGNLSSGDGGGFGHLGFSYHGDIEHNAFIFNQSTNPTIPANGGGLIVMGAPDADPTCGATVDTDCVPTPGSIGPSDGVGPGLVINANLIMGNGAESGTGGGIAFQSVNGSEVIAFPTTPAQWYAPAVTNNIIVNNVAGWDGGGVSLLDALNINVVNNTIASNTTTASAGPLFNTIGAPLASQHQNTGQQTTSATTSAPQVAGLVALQNSAVLQANLLPLETAGVTCPPNHYAGTTATNGTCIQYSYPLLLNDVFWQNSAYYIGVGALSPQFQQNVISLYLAFTTTLAPSQSNVDASTLNPASGTPGGGGGGSVITGGTGACVPGGASYWDIGVRGDTGPGNHGSTITLNPVHSVLTSTTGYDASNRATNPGFISQYCNGSRQPPEACGATGGCGWAVPPGISDATVPNPIFNLTPVATVDEGNNWVNMRWGPLSVTNPTFKVTGDGNWGNGPALGNYGLATTSSSAYGEGVTTFTGATVPTTDFYGTGRGTTRNDAGAVQFVSATGIAIASVTGGPLSFPATSVGSTSAAQTLTLHNTGSASVTTVALTFSSTAFSRPAGAAGGTCTATLAAGATCTINVVFQPSAAGGASATLTITSNVDVDGSPVALSGTGVAATLTATVSGGPLNFGSWAIGTPAAQRIAQTLTVTNTGNTALTGGTFTFAGANPGQFARASAAVPGGPGTCTATLAVGASCTYNVMFAPSAPAGSKGANLTVAYTGATITGSPVQTAGNAVTMAVQPTALAFGTVANGTTSAAQTLTVRNATGGARTLTITVPAPFARATGTAAGTCPTSTATTLGNGAACTIGVVFAPPAGTGGTSSTGSVSITTNGGFTVSNSPVTVTGTAN